MSTVYGQSRLYCDVSRVKGKASWGWFAKKKKKKKRRFLMKGYTAVGFAFVIHIKALHNLIRKRKKNPA